MGFATIVGTPTRGRSSAVNTTTHPVGIGTHATGDLIWAHFSAQGNSAHSTLSTDWTMLASVANGPVRGSVFVKIATSNAETLTVNTASGAQSTHTVYVLRPSSGMTFSAEVGPPGTGWSNNNYTGGFSPSGGAQDYLGIYAVANDGDTTFATNWSSYGGNFGSLGAAGPGGGSTTTGDYTTSGTTLDDGAMGDAPGNVDWVGLITAIWEIPGGGGGTTYDETVTESVVAGASQGASAVFPSARVESVVAGDVYGGAAIFVGALSESVTVADLRAAQAVFSAAYVETVTPADARAAQAIFSTAYSESIAAGDSRGNAQTFVASLTDSVSLSDQYSAGGSTTYNEVISESLVLADSLVASQVMTAALVESTALSDALQAVGIYGASVSEQVTAGDSLGAAVVFSASLAEAIALADAMGATQVHLSAVGETITISANFDATVTIPGGYPDPADVREGVSYGPTGIEYVGTFKGGKGMVWLRRR